MASSDVGTIRLGLEANANNFQRDIQNILNSTEGSVRSRAVRLGNIYRQQGMSQSSAMRRAWSEVRRTVSTSCNSMTRSSGIATNRISSAFLGVASKIATVFSVAVITAFTKKCIESAASVNALNSQFEQTFGSMQAQAEQALQTVAKNSGIVKSRLQGVGTSIYAFAKTTGMDSVSALNMMQEALQVTADSAAYYDRSLEDTAESLKSFLKGNFENDAALGLSCTETTRNAIANRLYGKSFIELSESQKQLALLQMVKEANQLSGAMGQASRESDGWENVTGNLKESWKQLLAVIGQPILKVATQAVKALTERLQILTEYAKQAGNAIGEVFGWKKDEASKAMSSVSDSADSATKSINETTKANEKLKNSLAGFDKLNVLKQEDESKSSADGATTTPIQSTNVSQANTELTATEKVLDRIKNKLKEIGLKLGFDDVNFGAIKSNIDNIFADLKPIAQSAFSGTEKIAKANFNIISKVVKSTVSVIGKQLQTATGGVSKWLDENKEKISTGITKISDNTSKGIENIGSFYDSVFSTLGSSIDRMRPTMETAISGLLGGFSNLGFSVADILSSAFSIATEEFSNWATNNQLIIGTFFDNIQGTFAQVAEFLGGIMTDVSDILTGWWYNGGAVTFSEICRAFTDVGTTLLNVYNQWIQPAIDCVIGIFKDCWEYTLKPITEQVISVAGKIGECIAAVWNNFLSPLVNWLVTTLAPVIKTVLNIVRGVFETVFKVIGDIISGFLKAIGGVIDFITGVFKGDWKKAWKGIFTILDGVWQMIWGVIKGVVNLVIDGINTLVGGIYSVFATIANIVGEAASIVGDVFGQDWGFSMPSEPPVIPKLAKGGIVKAPTLALVGDNIGANSGNPEVVAPLNKLKGMLNEGDGSAEDTAILSQILHYLIKIYEAISSNGNTNIIELVAKFDDSVVFKRMIELNNQYKKRHNGKSAFA